jgi:hypothetical protein
MKHEFTENMREISGFGGGYEEACRKMILAGVKWIEQHPDSNPIFWGYDKTTGTRTEDNEDAKSLENAILKLIPDCTGAMYGACLNHVLYIKKNGWEKYVEEMTK